MPKLHSLLILVAFTCQISIARADSSNGQSSNVILLTDLNFDKLVNKTHTWMIEVAAPWCPACRDLEPKWQALSGELKQQDILCGKIDPQQTILNHRLSIRHYPTIFLVKGSELREYSGLRTVQAMSSWAHDGWKSTSPKTGCSSPTSRCGRAYGAILSFPTRFKAMYMKLRQSYSDMTLLACFMAIPLSVGLMSICLLDIYYTRVAPDHLHQH